MKKTLTLNSDRNYETNESKILLIANIDNIKSMAELSDAIDELEELRFKISRIDCGDIQAEKEIDEIQEILSPVYKNFRCISRRCEEE
jgi:hypothetical protein